ncbi:hypothetical protein REPUB_Repub05bG0076300 [Reevesia pubescens]
MEYFLISKNELVGEIPSKICNLSRLRVLDLSKNMFIPDCLGNFSYYYLSVMDLRMKYFHGKIPRTFLKNGYLRSLNLNDNQLEGSIPQSLVNYSRLEVLDLGNNDLNDTFPYWLGMLSNLQVLVLRSNRFHGDIQNLNGASSFSRFRIIDLSQNEFSGYVPPKIFENFKAIKDIHEDKAGPNLTGNIPPSLGKLVALESLDLSSNRLEGRINSFAVLNLSQNNLVGPIPLANHFDTFTNDSFIGNSGLCVFPLSKKCGNDVEPETPRLAFDEVDDSATTLIWKIALIRYGCGLVFGLSLGYIVFTTR